MHTEPALTQAQLRAVAVYKSKQRLSDAWLDFWAAPRIDSARRAEIGTKAEKSLLADEIAADALENDATALEYIRRCNWLFDVLREEIAQAGGRIRELPPPVVESLIGVRPAEARAAERRQRIACGAPVMPAYRDGEQRPDIDEMRALDDLRILENARASRELGRHEAECGLALDAEMDRRRF